MRKSIVLLIAGGLACAPRDASDVVRQAPPTWRATIELRIGGADEMRDRYILTGVEGLVSDANVRIIVVDQQDNNAKVFSSAGAYLYTIGRPGDGPGDFAGPCCASFAHDGRLWIKERDNHRYSVFDAGPTSARFLYAVRIPPTNSTIDQSNPVTWDSANHVMDLAGVFGAPGAYLRRFADSTGRLVLQDTLPSAPADSLHGVELRSCSRTQPGACGSGGYRPPYGPSQLIAFGPNGELARAVSSTYAVSWTDQHGRRIALLQRAIVGPPLAATERARAQRLIDTIRARASQPNVQVVGQIPELPVTKAPLASIGFDLDGRVWAERSVALGEPHEADVYDRQGRWVAVMQWPSDVRLEPFWAVRGNTGVGIQRDSLDAQAVVRLRFEQRR